MRKFYISFGIVLASVMIGCGSKDTESEKVQCASQGAVSNLTQESYKKEPEMIDFFCRQMNLSLDELTIIHNFSTESVPGSKECQFEIGVNQDVEHSGTYIIGHYPDGLWRIVKRLSNSEESELGFQSFGDADLYEQIYSSIQQEVPKENVLQPEIDSSTVCPYEETRLDTNAIWEAYSGYLNQDDQYMVSYIGDVSDGWRQGVFRDGKWVVKHMPSIRNQAEDYYYTGLPDDTMWYCNGKVIQVYNKESEQIAKMDIKKWQEKNGIQASEEDDAKIVRCQSAYAILYGKQQGVQKSFLVNVRTGKMIKVYEGTVYGTCIENKLYSCDENNIFKVYNLNTGEYEKYIDISSIKKEYGTGKRYIGYSQSLPGFFELYNFDIPGIEAYNASVKFDIYKGTLYFIYFSGVYRYNEKENKLEKILDGKKMLLYKEMYGSFTVGKEEQIYMLGFQGGGDDEGATDFLYLRKKG